MLKAIYSIAGKIILIFLMVAVWSLFIISPLILLLDYLSTHYFCEDVSYLNLIFYLFLAYIFLRISMGIEEKERRKIRKAIGKNRPL